MDATMSEWLNLIFRWTHVVAGITWIGLLYFFNFINGAVAATMDADTKKKVLPELLPRTLYWFRWGAAYTWITGILLLGIVYYMGGIMVEAGSTLSVGASTGIGLGLLLVGWVVYDMMWKAMAKNEQAAVGISFVLVAVIAWWLSTQFSGRAMFIHIGALFGTLMAANVWMRIWPAQRKIIKATKEGGTPPPEAGPMAKLRSKHNTYMSVPLVFLMLSSHFPTVYGHEMGYAMVAGFTAVGWLITKFLYNKGASDAPKFF